MTPEDARFGTAALRLLEGGYLPIPLTGKMPIVKGWATLRSTKARRLARMAAYAKSNVGLRCGRLVVIDIDTETEEEAANILDVLLNTLGDSGFVRVGRWPRLAFLYRSACPVTSRKIGAVEILGRGRQVAAFGVHPVTRAPYAWPDHCILDVPLAELPLATSKSLKAFMHGLESRVAATSGGLGSQVSDVNGEAAASGDHQRTAQPTGHPQKRTGGRPYGASRALPAAGQLPQVGERNNWLFYQLLIRAAGLPNAKAIEREARRLNSMIPVPLPTSEVVATARSVAQFRPGWGEERDYRRITRDVRRWAPAGLTAHAAQLYRLLVATRTKPEFEIPEVGTAACLGWTRYRLGKARDELILKGHLEMIGKRKWQNRGHPCNVYRFTTTTTTTNTTSPPSPATPSPNNNTCIYCVEIPPPP